MRPGAECQEDVVEYAVHYGPVKAERKRMSKSKRKI
jgi:cysteinyl-tRNA synthetase